MSWGTLRRTALASTLLAGAAVVATAAGPAQAAGPMATPTTNTPTTNIEWPSYGADLANSRTVAGGPAPTAVPTLAQAWRVDFSDGDFTGTPVVSHRVVYVGSNGGLVRAIQAVATPGHKAGTVLWTTATSAAHDPVNGAVAVSGGIVYVPVARQGSPAVLALNAATGHRLWSRTLDTSTDADVYGSPVVAPDRSGRLLVLQGVSAVSGDPASPLRGSLLALDAGTGRTIWKSYAVPRGFNGGAVWSTPAVDTATGTVYVGTGNAYSGTAAPTTDAILAIDIGSGKIKAAFQATANDVFSSSTPGLDFDFGASPNLMTIGKRRLVGEGQKSGTYWAVDATTMAPAWHTQAGPGSVVGGILGSTAYDAATQQIVGPISAPGYIWSLHADSGLPAWATVAAADPAHLSPVAISNGVVYSLAASGLLEAWLEQTGTPLVELPLNRPGGTSLSLGGVSVADGLVIANTGSQGSTGSVVAFGPATA
jgi:polyvinyl alcohol dehydrogenase (cytochrome)